MKNSNMPAMPVPLNPGSSFQEHGPADDLTKREYFAALAMQGLLASWGQHDVTAANEIASDAVGMADALLAALEENNQ